MKHGAVYEIAWIVLVICGALWTTAAARADSGRVPFAATQPASIQEWEQQRVALRARLWRLLGDMPARFVPQATVLNREERDGYTLEHFSFDNHAGDTVFGYLLIPDGGGKRPAILYHHCHTSHERVGKEEIIRPSETLGGQLPGEVLARAGYVVMCIDAYTFGERRHAGPGGAKGNGNQTEESFFKLFLWEGTSLWSMMVRDDLLALEYLLTRPEVDTQRVGSAGFSMGATRTWWAAALDDRICAAVSVGCLTRYQDLIAAGGLRFHSIYFFVPGMLKEGIDMESVVALVAPRPHLTLTGDRDDGSPVSGVRTINRFAQHVYRLYGCEEDFRGIVYPDTGHAFTPQMWHEMLAWFDSKLK
ncbi:MAG TPA: dienelactone hydrolase family protein [Phycisphaerae bacterium]|nr:dienelactone hydrolase family protein [Phycisphaerae bacterium]